MVLPINRMGATRRLTMKISTFAIQQKALSYFAKRQTTKAKTEISQENINDEKSTSGAKRLDFVDLMLSGNSKTNNTDEIESLSLSDEDKIKVRLLEHVMSVITGKPFKFKFAFKVNKQQGSETSLADTLSFGSSAKDNLTLSKIKINYSQSYYEKERFSFSSKGLINTEDGNSIKFNYSLSMSREYYEENQFSLHMDEVLKDPLVINFDGKGLKFSELDMSLDLDVDGQSETFKAPAEGSGFLAIDHNENGEIDNGGELFGPATGKGFKELATYDDDGNGWIDENDEVFHALKIWSVNESGSTEVLALSEKGIGAIYLGSVGGDYHVKFGSDLVGKVKQSSFYVQESGKVGAIHEVDLEV